MQKKFLLLQVIMQKHKILPMKMPKLWRAQMGSRRRRRAKKMQQRWQRWQRNIHDNWYDKRRRRNKDNNADDWHHKWQRWRRKWRMWTKASRWRGRRFLFIVELIIITSTYNSWFPVHSVLLAKQVYLSAFCSPSGKQWYVCHWAEPLKVPSQLIIEQSTARDLEKSLSKSNR